MPTPDSPLNSVLRLREIHRDQTHRQWAEARAAEATEAGSLARLQEDLRRLHLRLRQALTPGTLDVDEILAIKAQQRSLRAQSQVCRQRCLQAGQRSADQQAALADADRQVRVIERLAERQQQQRQHEQAVEEIHTLDDLNARGR